MTLTCNFRRGWDDLKRQQQNDEMSYSGDIMMGPDGPTPIAARHRKGLGHVFDEAREFLEDSGRRFRRLRGSGRTSNSGQHVDVSQLATTRKASNGKHGLAHDVNDDQLLHSPTPRYTGSLDDSALVEHSDPKGSRHRRPSFPDILLNGIGIGCHRSSNATPTRLGSGAHRSSNATPTQTGSSDTSQPSNARSRRRRPGLAIINLPMFFGSGGGPPAVIVDETVGPSQPEREEMC